MSNQMTTVSDQNLSQSDITFGASAYDGQAVTFGTPESLLIVPKVLPPIHCTNFSHSMVPMSKPNKRYLSAKY